MKLAGIETFRKVAAAFGLKGVPVQKLVLVFDVADPVLRVFVKAVGEEAAFERVAEMYSVEKVGDVSVSDDCTVVFTPFIGGDA